MVVTQLLKLSLCCPLSVNKGYLIFFPPWYRYIHFYWKTPTKVELLAQPSLKENW